MLERGLDKGSWPEVLPEVAFYCNNVENSSTKFSAQLLMFGRQPTSPIDATIAEYQQKSPDFPRHVEDLQKLSAEIRALARENDHQTRKERNSYHNRGTIVPRLVRGDWVFERNEKARDSLDRKFNGPYKVLDVRDTGIKVQKGRRRKWIHVSRCKQFAEGSPILEPTSSINPIVASGPPQQVTASATVDTSEMKEENRNQGLSSTLQKEAPAAHEEQSQADDVAVDTQEEERNAIRRYPVRTRKPKEYPDYVLCGNRPYTAF